MLENRNMFLKQICLFSVLAFIPFFTIWWIRNEWVLFYVGFLNLFPVAITYWFIHKGKLEWASFSSVIFACLNVYMYDDGFGGNTGYYYYLVSTILCGFILFEPNEIRLRTTGIGISLLVLILTNIPGASPRFYNQIEGLDITQFHLYTVNFIVATILTFAVVYYMVAAYRKSEKRLNEALSQAQEVAELKTQFLSNMSHELRTPMNAVVGMTDILIQENPRPDQLEHLNVLRFSSGNLLHIINDILDYSRIEAGKTEWDNNPFVLRSLLKNLQASLQPQAQAKNIAFSFEIEPNVPGKLSGDENRLIQVLNNLLSNAIKFTHEGKVNLTVRVKSVSPELCKLVFLVRDTGIGIPADKQQVIFDRFTQVSSDMTRQYGGTGLGLAICKRLLEAQNSRIYVSSVLGQGSEFVFALEFNQVHESVVMEKSPSIISDAIRNVRVLLAEDNAINQLIARKFLEGWGVDLKVVNNGREALAHVKANEVDLVLMDLQMPEMDGYEATRSIRRLQGDHFGKLPIIALSASEANEIGEMYSKCGMNDFVHKPFNPEDLFQKMTLHLA